MIFSKAQCDLIEQFDNRMMQKDPRTHRHVRDVRRLAVVICRALPDSLRSQIDERRLMVGALLHDIGTLKIPNEILHHQQALCDADREKLNRRLEHGRRMLQHTPLQGLIPLIAPDLDMPNLEAKVIIVASRYCRARAHLMWSRLDLKTIAALVDEVGESQRECA